MRILAALNRKVNLLCHFRRLLIFLKYLKLSYVQGVVCQLLYEEIFDGMRIFGRFLALK